MVCGESSPALGRPRETRPLACLRKPKASGGNPQLAATIVHQSSKHWAWQLRKMTYFLPTQTKRLHLGLGKVSLIRPSVNHVAWVPLSYSSFPPFSPPTLKPAINAAGTEENEAVGFSKYYWAPQGNAAPLFRLPCLRHILITSI